VAAVNSLSGTINYWFDKKLTTGIAQAQLANELITWEKSKQFDVGLDLTLFKSRLSLTADYYIRNISGMLQQFDLPDFVGMSAPWQNAGSMRNNGWEVSIGWQHNAWAICLYDREYP
jgi:outer membrane receptor protein involved in Fe transport